MADFTSTVELRANTGKLERSMATARKSMDKLGKTAKTTNSRFDAFGKKSSRSMNKLNKSAMATNTTMSSLKNTIVAMASGVALLALGTGVAKAASKFEILRAQLKTMTGDSKKAEVAFNRLKKFSDVTPFDFEQSIKGFVKLKALGLVDTIEEGEKALNSYGNTAAAMGKTLEQMVEAVADAATGENERLKEFGIKAKKQGQQTAYTFQGVTTVVRNSAKDIQRYLMGIGNFEFAGAMAEQAKGITAAMSNLRTNFSLFLDGIGNGLGAVSMMTAAFNKMSGVLDNMINAMKNNTESFQTFKKMVVATTTAGVAFLAAYSVSKLKSIAYGLINITRAMATNPLFLIGAAGGFAIVKLFEKFGGFEDGFTHALDRMHYSWSYWVAGFRDNALFKAFDTTLVSIETGFTTTIDTLSKLDWSSAWDTAKSSASTAFGVGSAMYDSLEGPVKNSYNYVKNLNWALAWQKLKSATSTVLAVTDGIMDRLSTPIANAYETVKNLNWASAWQKLKSATATVLVVTGGIVDKLATPIANAYETVKNLNWSLAWQKLKSATATVLAVTGGIVDRLKTPIKSAYNYMTGLKWDLAWGVLGDVTNTLLDITKTVFDYLEKPVKSAYDYMVGLDWALAWGVLGDATKDLLDITKAVYGKLEKPVKSAYDTMTSLTWGKVWGSLGTDTESIKTAMSDLYNKVAMPVANVFMYIKNINWGLLWGGLEAGIQKVKDWFYDMYIYLVGNSVVPDMVDEIDAEFAWMVTQCVDSAKHIYNKVTSFFRDLWKDVTSESDIGAKSVKDAMASMFKKNPGDGGGSKFTDMLSGVTDALKDIGTWAVVAAGAVATVLGVSAVTKFKYAISSVFDTFRSGATALSGKQGLMNQIMFGREGGSRATNTAVRKAARHLKDIDDAAALQTKRKQDRDPKLRRTGGSPAQMVRNVQINNLASLPEKELLTAKKNATKARIAALAQDYKPDGPVKRTIFGQSGDTGVLNRIKGLAGQVKLLGNTIVGMVKNVVSFVSSFTVISNSFKLIFKILGLPLMVIIGLYDAWTGWSDAIDTDKDGIVSTFEKIKGASGKVVAGLTLGLVDIEAVSTWMDNLFSGDMEKTLTALFQVTPFGLVDGFLSKVFKWVGDWLGFDTTRIAELQDKGGLSGLAAKFVKESLTAITSTISNWFVNMSTVEVGGVTMLTPIGLLAKGLKAAEAKAVSTIEEFFFGVDTLKTEARSLSQLISIGVAVAWSITTEAVSNFFSGSASSFKKQGSVFERNRDNTVGEMIGNGLKNAWANLTATVDNWFSGSVTAVYNLYDEIKSDITGTWKSITDTVTGWFDFTMPSFGNIGTLITELIADAIADAKSVIQSALGIGTEPKAPPVATTSQSSDYNRGDFPTVQANAAGGFISGSGTGTSDSIPSMLSNGEFVVNAKSARGNVGALNAINKGAPISNVPGPINSDRLIKQMHSDEGMRLDAYMDTEKKLTVGYGHKVLKKDNLKLGDVISRDRAEAFFKKDLPTAEAGASRVVPSYNRAPSELKEVLANMVFQMGPTGVKKFENMIDGINEANYPKASREMLDSDWAGQTPERANRLASIVNRIEDTQGYAKFATGGAVNGAGSGTSDSIPAMLSNGEFVINAKAAGKHRALLETINGGKGNTGSTAKFAPGGAVGPADQYSMDNRNPSVRYTDGSFDIGKTLKAFNGYFEEGSDELALFNKNILLLDDQIGRLTQAESQNHGLVMKMNKLFVVKDKVERENLLTTEESAAATQALTASLGKLKEGLGNVFAGAGQSFTGGLISAIQNGGSIGDALGQGFKGLMKNVTGKLLDRGFQPLEALIDSQIKGLDPLQGATTSGQFSTYQKESLALNKQVLTSLGEDKFSDALSNQTESQRGIFGSLGSIFHSGLSGLGGMMSSLGSSLGGLFSGGGDGIGGLISAGLSIFGFANGGQVSGPGSGTSDSIMARLSNGEFVVNAQAAQANMGLLTEINGGYNKGGQKGTHKGENKGKKSSLAGLLKFLLPGAGLLEMLMNALPDAGPNGLFPNSTLGGLIPDLPTRAVMERGRGFSALNGGGSGGYSTTAADAKRAEGRRTNLTDRLFTTKARKDELQQLTTGQRAAYEAGVRQKGANANNVMSRVSGGKLGVSNRQREAPVLSSIRNRTKSNVTDSSGKSIGGVANSFNRSDSRLKAAAPRTGHPSATALPANTGHPTAKFATGGLVGRPKTRVPKYATGGSVNTGTGSSDGPIYLTVNNSYDVQSAMNPQEFQAMLVSNNDLTMLSVEKKLRETGRTLFK